MIWVVMLINILSLLVRVDHGGAVTELFFVLARLDMLVICHRFCLVFRIHELSLKIN